MNNLGQYLGGTSSGPAEMGRDSAFSDAVKEAEGYAVVGAMSVIRKSAESGNWQAAAWFLERRYPQQFGRRTTVRPQTQHDAARLF